MATTASSGSPQSESPHPKHPRRQPPKPHVAHRSHTKRHSMGGGSHSNLAHLGSGGGTGPRRSESGGSRKKGLDALGLGMAAVRPPSTTSMGQVMTASTAMKRGSSGGLFVSPDRPRMPRATSHSSVGSQGSGSKLRMSGAGRTNGKATKAKANAGRKAGAFKGALEDEDDDEEEELVVTDDEGAPQEEDAERGRPNGEQQPARPPSVPPEDSVLAHRANVPGVPPAALSTAPIGEPAPPPAPPGHDEDEWVSEPSTRAPSNAPTRPSSAAPTPLSASRTMPAAPSGISRSGVPSPLTATTPRRKTETSVPPSPVELDDDPESNRGRERVRGRSTSRTRAEEEARAQRAARELRMSRSRSRNSGGTGGGGVRALSQRAPSDSPAGSGGGGRRQLAGKGSPFADDRGAKTGGATPVRAPSVASAKTTEIVAAEPPQPEPRQPPAPVPAPTASGRKTSNLRKAPSSGSLRSTHSFAGFGSLGSGDRGSVRGPSHAVLQPQLDRSQVVVSLSARDDDEAPTGDKGKAKARAPQRISLQGVQWDQEPTTATDPDQQQPRKGPAGTLTPLEAAKLAQRLRKTSAPTAPGSGGSDGSATSPPLLSPRRLRKTSGYFGSLRSLVGLAVPEEDDEADGKPKADPHRGLQRAVTAPLGMSAMESSSASTGPKKTSAAPVATAPVTRRPAPLISKFISPSETERHPISVSPASTMRFPTGSSTHADSTTPRRAYSGAGLSRTQQRMLLQRDAPIALPQDESTAPPAHVMRNLGHRPGPVPMMPLAAAAVAATAGPSSGHHHHHHPSHHHHAATLPQPGQHNLNAPAMRARYAQIFERWLGALMDEAERVGREHETASRWRDPVAESFARVASAKSGLKPADPPQQPL